MQEKQNVTPEKINWRNPPVPPSESDWSFTSELQSPLWRKMEWQMREAEKDEAFLGGGATILRKFPDPEGVLDTAYADLDRFFDALTIDRAGNYRIITRKTEMKARESWRIEVDELQCVISAGDTEGIRRAVFYLEDEMRRNEGPFLKLGCIEKTPFVKTRISRCFFGPIKRPPKNRDELLDDVNYYPDEYLNRLAHDGVNALWLTVEFKDLCKTSIAPGGGKDARKRFVKLRKTIKQCSRYGIKIYLFCIEPRAIPSDSLIFKKYPELKGASMGKAKNCFCPCSENGRKYLEDAVYQVFSKAPGLGGMINISLGERPTTCVSAGSNNDCPRCSHREYWEVLASSLSAMKKGMQSANPEAELISWLYLPDADKRYSLEDVVKIAENTPDGVIIQLNFESGGRQRQLGKNQCAGDYWLSYPGPSDFFSDIAKAARQNGTEISAKLQVGCSHEVATVPYVPAPGNLYEKYRSMRELGVSSCMQCWYFGNYPSMMTKAAGELSFEPFPETEKDFLESLARLYWGSKANQATKAWRHFKKAYLNYPLSAMVQYYGPAHDGPTWPLFLEPADSLLIPTWQTSSPITLEPYPPSGDRIGEFMAYTHTAEEILVLFERLAVNWQYGVDALNELIPESRGHMEKNKDIGVAAALGIQFHSAYNIVKFYLLRESLPNLSAAQKLKTLAEMKNIVKTEINNAKKLLELCLYDSRLGFHSEAEGYKYFPAKIDWRIKQLEHEIANEFPKVERAVGNRKKLFPAHTGEKPVGPRYSCCKFDVGTINWKTGAFSGNVWDALPEAKCDFKIFDIGDGNFAKNIKSSTRFKSKTHWKASHDAEYLYIATWCEEPEMGKLRDWRKDKKYGDIWNLDNDLVVIQIEPKRLWPAYALMVNPAGARCQKKNTHDARYHWSAAAKKEESGWSAIIRISLKQLRKDGFDGKKLRMNVYRFTPHKNACGIIRSWNELHPLPPRLALGRDNPKDLGWLFFTC